MSELLSEAQKFLLACNMPSDIIRVRVGKEKLSVGFVRFHLDSALLSV